MEVADNSTLGGDSWLHSKKSRECIIIVCNEDNEGNDATTKRRRRDIDIYIDTKQARCGVVGCAGLRVGFACSGMRWGGTYSNLVGTRTLLLVEYSSQVRGRE